MTTRKSDGKNYKQAKPTQGHKIRFNYFKAGTQVRHTVTSLQLAAIKRPGTREEKIHKTLKALTNLCCLFSLMKDSQVYFHLEEPEKQQKIKPTD